MISDSEILFWMSISGVSIARQSKAIKHSGSVANIWNNLTSDDKLKELFKDKYDILLRYRSEQYVGDCLERLRKLEIKVITIYNPCYGTLLRQPEVAAPYVFYYKGNPKLFSSDCFGIVGTRSCSNYGKQMAGNISGTLAENGLTIVSGLATGIDAYAHEAALEAKGKTVAVLGSGLNKFGPVGNKWLFDKILAEGGAVMTEYLPNVVATKYTFPERNRLISGLSKGVCVVEAGEKSGALITAKFALDQNRDVFAVPGNVGNIRSEGTNNLLYEGALIARSGEDILHHYGVEVKKNGKSEEDLVLSDNSKRIYDYLKNEDTVSFDDIVEKLSIAPADASVALTELEINQLVQRVSSNEFAKIGD